MHMTIGDSAGTNRYLIKKNFYPSNPTASQLYMGPLWDFDAIFRTPENWCALHNRSYSFYFPQLLDRQDFYLSYLHQWEAVSATFHSNIIEALHNLYNEKGEAIDASRLLDNKRWYTNVPYKSLSTEIDETDKWMKAQTKFIDTKLLTRYQLQFVVNNDVIHTDSLFYREEITYPAVDVEEGLSFEGWDITPSSMPANNLIITGSFSTANIIDMPYNEAENPTIVDLSGRRYDSLENLNRGIYIVNGKKTFIH